MPFQKGNVMGIRKRTLTPPPKPVPPPVFAPVRTVDLPEPAVIVAPTDAAPQPYAAGAPLPSVRRFGMADIMTHAGWLIGRLREHYPHLTEANIVGWLRTVIDSNECLMLRSDNGAGLALIYREELDTAPRAREAWTFVKPGHDGEGRAMMAEYHRWARMHGAAALTLSAFSDVPAETARQMYGRLKTQTTHAIDLGRA